MRHTQRVAPGAYAVIGSTLIVRSRRGQLAQDLTLAGGRPLAGRTTFVRQ